METERKIRCTCECHSTEDKFKNMVHFVPCCNSGWIRVYTKDYWGDLEKDTYPLDYEDVETIDKRTKYLAELQIINNAIETGIYGISRLTDYPDGYSISNSELDVPGSRRLSIMTGHGGVLRYIETFNEVLQDRYGE